MTKLEADDRPEPDAHSLDRVTAELGSPLAPSDRCPSCSARMAADQRYCIECGERRSGGGLRDALPRTQAAGAAPSRARRTPFASPNSSLIAGVGTLVLALGVGVLIGRTGHTSSTHSATPQVVTVQTSGAAGSGTSAVAATSASAATAKKSSKHHRARTSSGKAASSFQKTAAKSGVKLPPPVVKVGSKCPQGAKGCQGGKFTGNFFGGG
jgi:hypothetical protein